MQHPLGRARRRPEPTEPLSEDAFRGCYDEHSTAVHSYVSAMCGLSQADDITRDVFVALWRDGSHNDLHGSSMRTLLLTMADQRTVGSTRPNAPPEPQSATGGATATRVAAAVATLPTDERRAVLLAFWGDGTCDAVAATIGVPESTVRATIRSGLQRLNLALATTTADRSSREWLRDVERDRAR